MIELHSRVQPGGRPPRPTPVHPDSMYRLAQATAAVCRLPAAATTDWCDRAAAAVSRLSPHSFVLTILARVDSTGGILAHEAVGVAASDEDRKHATLCAPASGTWIEPCLGMLRSRAEQLTSLTFAADLTGMEGDGRARGPRAASGVTRTGELARLWEGVPCDDLTAGMAPLGESTLRRVLAVLAATPEPDPDLPAKLAATMPALAERARRAMDAVGVDSRGWLTPREQRVLEHLTLGRSVRQIADALGRSPHTIHDHVKSLHRKLKASTRGELIARALGYAPSDRDGEAATVVVAPGTDHAATFETA